MSNISESWILNYAIEPHQTYKLSVLVMTTRLTLSPKLVHFIHSLLMETKQRILVLMFKLQYIWDLIFVVYFINLVGGSLYKISEASFQYSSKFFLC